ncbi:MAG: YiiX/YebB-like N1pC/P60 family cysteine hydrolase [Candidatus Binatia bacterium]
MSASFHPLLAVRRAIIRQFANLLTKPLKNYAPRFPNDLAALKRSIRKGDIILVEGEQRISEVIKYLTQSSWSHSAIYIGDELVRQNHPQLGQIRALYGDEVNELLIEALVETGVVVSPLSKYIPFNVRVSRPHLLRKEHLQIVVDDVISQLGHSYDMQNIFDLARYFFPVSLVPRRFRRKALYFGSGLPTEVICSSMIAAAFDKVGFPIIPQITAKRMEETARRTWLERIFLRPHESPERLIFRRRHHTLVTPRDFDLSPYFEVIKFNVIESGRFDYSRIIWEENEKEEKNASGTETEPAPVKAAVRS